MSHALSLKMAMSLPPYAKMDKTLKKQIFVDSMASILYHYFLADCKDFEEFDTHMSLLFGNGNDHELFAIRNFIGGQFYKIWLHKLMTEMMKQKFPEESSARLKRNFIWPYTRMFVTRGNKDICRALISAILQKFEKKMEQKNDISNSFYGFDF